MITTIKSSIIVVWSYFPQMILRFYANISILFNILLWNLGKIGGFKVDCLHKRLLLPVVKPKIWQIFVFLISFCLLILRIGSGMNKLLLIFKMYKLKKTF